jgi:AmmeMemoRadiSam system protein A
MSRLIQAYALPHPPLAVPGVGKGQENGIKKTLDAFDAASKEIAAFAPETIIFITPHNVLYADYFHISPGASASGGFSSFNDHKTKLTAQYDKALAAEITNIAKSKGIHAGNLGEKNAELDHGVTVPMWFINNRYSSYMTVRVSQSGFSPAEHYSFGKCIAEAAEKSGKKTVLIASSDLSHRLDPTGPNGYAPEGKQFDSAITKILASGNFLELLELSENMRKRAGECGYNSLTILAGFLDCKKVKSELLSYEAPFGVGYAVASFVPTGDAPDRNFLKQYEDAATVRIEETRKSEDIYRALARKSLEHTIRTNERLVMPKDLSSELRDRKAGVFVSIHKDGDLRGCVGTILPSTKNIASEIIQNAVSAGLKDNRFEPVSEAELARLTYKVDVLAEPEPISGPELLDVKRYGVIVTSGHKRGLLLPNLDGIDTVEQQIDIARQKAGIYKGENIKLERFEVTRYGGDE